MKKLILLLVALPLFLANCAKDAPEGPTTTTTTYKGIFTHGTSIDATYTETPGLVVVTENGTSWSMSLELNNQMPQVITATKTGTAIQFTNQTYLTNTVQGKGELTGTHLHFTIETGSGTTTSQIAVFDGEKHD